MNTDTIAKLAISEADRAYCEAHQQAYAAMQGVLLATKKQWCAAWQEQVQYLGRHKAREYFGARSDEDVRAEQVIAHLEGLPYRFIHALAHHFETEYAVEISEEDIQEQLYPKEPGPYHPESEKTAYHTALQETVLQYEDILRLIAQQFEGRSLQEQAVYTLKTNCFIAAHRFSGMPTYSMKEHMIVFTQYACRYAKGNLFPWQLTEAMLPIIRGFEHYEIGSINPPIASCYSDSFIPFVGGKKVMGLRMYKNGRIDLLFRSQENAYDFAREYLTEATQP